MVKSEECGMEEKATGRRGGIGWKNGRGRGTQSHRKLGTPLGSEDPRPSYSRTLRVLRETPRCLTGTAVFVVCQLLKTREPQTFQSTGGRVMLL